MAMAISLQDFQVTKNMLWDHGLSQEDATNDQNVTKSRLFLQFQLFLVFFAYNSIINNNINDEEARASLIYFCQLIKMHNSGEMKSFCPTVAIPQALI